MRRCFCAVVALVLAVLAAGPAAADEGMWPLYDLNQLDFKALKARGLALTPEEIFNAQGTGLATAIFNLGGGTGSFVSKDGLIVTNHHVAFGAIQQQSSVETNYIRDGFYARTRADEIPAVGYTLRVTLSVEDVTARVMANVTAAMDDLARFKAIDAARKQIIQECEKSEDVKCQVSAMFGGTQYVLCTDLEIRDIRIVYVPPAAIGQYGGEIDNFMWPRHTGDYSFLRAYVAPDGSPAEYAEENVPYHPKVWLPISKAGIRENDLALVIGFPGFTDRYACSYSVDNLVHIQYPEIIDIVEHMIGILDEASAADSSVAIRVAANSEGLKNTLKYQYGLRDGFQKADLLGEKKATENELKAYLEKNPDAKKKYGRVLPDLEAVYREIMNTRKKDLTLRLMNFGSDDYGLSYRIYRWATEREKPDMERDRGYQDRDSTDVWQEIRDAQINLVPSVDRTTFRYFLARALSLPEGQRILAFDRAFAGKNPDTYMDTFLDGLYGKTKVGDLDSRMAMLRMSREQLEKLGDPFINLIASLRPENDERIEREKRTQGALSRLNPQLIGAYREWKGGNLYPDANSTKRLSYGSVEGYVPRDAVSYHYLTTLTGVMEKETGEDPFVVPAELKKAWQTKNFGPYVDRVVGDVPVCFLTTNDTTGGNSGSPVMNGKGELIGLVFDGNYESMAADYLFDPALTRAIMVDVRYILFTIDKVYGLTGLVSELTVR